MTVRLTSSSFSTQPFPEKVGPLKGMRVQATPVITRPLPQEKVIPKSTATEDNDGLWRRILNLARHLGDQDDLDFVARMSGDTQRRKGGTTPQHPKRVSVQRKQQPLSSLDPLIIIDPKGDAGLMQQIHAHVQALQAEGRSADLLNPFHGPFDEWHTAHIRAPATRTRG